MIAREEVERAEARPPHSLVDILESTAARLAGRAAAKQKCEGRWVDTTWSELAQRARNVADGLASLGVKKGERVAILGESSVEWIIADLGGMGAAAVTVPIYQSSLPHECRYILEHSGACYVFCDGQSQVDKIREVRSELPALKGIIRFAGTARDDFERTLDSLERAGVAFRAGNEDAHAARLAGLSLSEPASFIYTSGTTGKPKGVELTHGNFVYVNEAVGRIKLVRSDDLVLLFLPMAHVFARAIEAMWLGTGSAVAFVESIDKVIENAGEVRPTLMPAVPRVFEKAYNAAASKGLTTPGLKGKLFKLALQSLDAHLRARELGQRDIASQLGMLLAKRLVFPKLGAILAERFGGRMRLFVSGGAPLSVKIAWFFRLAGLEIVEGYGLTETTGPAFVNLPGRVRIGTVGPALPGTEVRIAEDGEVLLRGAGIMKGYYANPEATAEAMKGGWFHTGDIGELDRDGYLKLTDRKKDIIVTAGGKNVAPQNLESELKSDPLVSFVVVHGDKRKFLSALVTLNEENVRAWMRENRVPQDGPLHDNPGVRARIQSTFDALNARQPSYSTIKKFAILPKDFSQQTGELTPSLKLKRKYCTEKYKETLDAFYVE